MLYVSIVCRTHNKMIFHTCKCKARFIYLWMTSSVTKRAIFVDIILNKRNYEIIISRYQFGVAWLRAMTFFIMLIGTWHTSPVCNQKYYLNSELNVRFTMLWIGTCLIVLYQSNLQFYMDCVQKIGISKYVHTHFLQTCFLTSPDKTGCETCCQILLFREFA